jgi:hypothetical protein
VVAALAEDWDAARRVELSLPATGVCSSTAGESCAPEVSCCESQPVVVGATLSAPRRR